MATGFSIGDIIKVKNPDVIRSEGKTPITSSGSLAGYPTYCSGCMRAVFDSDFTYRISEINLSPTYDSYSCRRFYKVYLAGNEDQFFDDDSLKNRYHSVVYNMEGCYFSLDDIELVMRVANEDFCNLEAGDRIITKSIDNIEDRIGGFYRSREDLEEFCGMSATVIDSNFNSSSKMNYPISYFARVDGGGCDFTLYPQDVDRMWDESFVQPPIKRKFYCDRCGAVYWLTSEELAELNKTPNDTCLCETCRERNFVTPYHRYAPDIKFYKNKYDRNNLFFGFELEVDKGGESNVYASAAKNIVNNVAGKHYLYCSHDGSLENGFEIISQPATLKYHESMRDEYEKMFKFLVKNGYRSHDASTTGIHIHFSRKFYENDEDNNITKLLYLVERFWDEIVIFSRRDYNTLERYAKKVDGNKTEFVKSYNKSAQHSGHYYSVNITNRDTIELRFYRGTLNINTFMGILYFSNALIRAAKNKTNEQLQSMKFEELLDDNTREYYYSRLGMSKFEERDMCNAVLSSNTESSGRDNSGNNYTWEVVDDYWCDNDDEYDDDDEYDEE